MLESFFSFIEKHHLVFRLKLFAWLPFLFLGPMLIGFCSSAAILKQSKKGVEQKLSEAHGIIASHLQSRAKAVANAARTIAKNGIVVRTIEYTKKAETKKPGSFIDKAHEILLNHFNKNEDMFGQGVTVIMDENGIILAQNPERRSFGKTLPGVAELISGATDSSKAGVWNRGAVSYEYAIAPVKPKKPIGYVLVAQAIDDRAITDLKTLCGAEIAIVRGGEILASSLPPKMLPPLMDTIGEREKKGPGNGGGEAGKTQPVTFLFGSTEGEDFPYLTKYYIQSLGWGSGTYYTPPLTGLKYVAAIRLAPAFELARGPVKFGFVVGLVGFLLGLIYASYLMISFERPIAYATNMLTGALEGKIDFNAPDPGTPRNRSTIWPMPRIASCND
ncbi:MAG: hypothetical protein ABIH03_05375 [Pseudomonadota bacterium]